MDYLINEERCRSLLLTECPDDFSFEHELRKESGNEWIVVKKNPKILRSINLSGDFESYLDGRNKKLRHELFRKAKKLQKSGITTLKCFQKENDVNEVFEIINDIENDSWKFKCGTAIISSEQETSFYRSLYRMYARNFSARTYVLELNRVPLAYVMGVVFDHTYYALKTSYKEAYKKLSPGALLFSKTIESLMCNNSKEKAIELLGEDSRWKAELSTDRRELCTYQLYPRCLKNICYLAGRKYIKEIRKLVQYIHTGP
jgi:CelD/BcsL family acetyltransferase involved in cellulose biosynthesis